MLTKDFAYDLPESHIARYPTAKRTDSRLLVLHKHLGKIRDHVFTDLPRYLQAGDLIIVNNSRVMQARLYGAKESGGKVEILVERIVNAQQAWAHVYVNRQPQLNSWIILDSEMRAQVLQHNPANGCYLLQFVTSKPLTVLEILELYGVVPLPPYMNRAAELADLERYQTVYSQPLGSIAAPTAGLHFSEELIASLKSKGVLFNHVTLHVGSGTFQPVKAVNINDHKMHDEWYNVSPELCAQVTATKQRGNKVICVGSTATRAMETAALSGTLVPSSGYTDIFITPGFKFKIADAMITNFHIPESTLLMLVSAMAGRENILNAYRYAITNNYRFYSYGDAMLIIDTREL